MFVIRLFHDKNVRFRLQWIEFINVVLAWISILPPDHVSWKQWVFERKKMGEIFLLRSSLVLTLFVGLKFCYISDPFWITIILRWKNSDLRLFRDISQSRPQQRVTQEMFVQVFLWKQKWREHWSCETKRHDVAIWS